MANKKKLLGIFGLLLVFSASILTGCPAEDTGGNTPAEPPPLTGTVRIIGSQEAGTTLTVDTSGLRGYGTISYQWRRNSTNIPGETASSYTVKAADTGSTITVRVSRDGYSGFVDGSIDPVLTGIVTITGTPRQGMTLTADTSELGGSGTISYQWLRNSVEIGGAVSSTYTVKELDFGTTLKVKVSRSGYSGFVEGTLAIPSPKTYTITLKKTGGVIGSGGSLQKIIFEGANGSRLAETSQAVGASPVTVNVTSYDSQFKMRIEWTLIDLKYYFKNGTGSAAGEIFDFKDGTVTYNLAYTYTSPVYYDRFAVEE